MVVWVFLRRYHLTGLARMLAFGKARIYEKREEIEGASTEERE